MNCNCSNPITGTDAQVISSLDSPSLARVANPVALQSLGNGAAFVQGGLNVRSSTNSALRGRYAAKDNRVEPTVVKLIVDTTANGAQAITDFPLIDAKDAFKAYNTIRQASAGAGVVYGRTAGDTTKVSLNTKGNTSGYDEYRSTICTGGTVVQNLEVYTIVAGKKQAVSLQMSMQYKNVQTSQWIIAGQHFDPIDQISCTDQITSVITLTEDMRHIPGLGAIVISSLEPGQVYYINLGVVGHVE
jgi:hypothetical protein